MGSNNMYGNMEENKKDKTRVGGLEKEEYKTGAGAEGSCSLVQAE